MLLQTSRIIADNELLQTSGVIAHVEYCCWLRDLLLISGVIAEVERVIAKSNIVADVGNYCSHRMLLPTSKIVAQYCCLRRILLLTLRFITQVEYCLT